MTFLDAFEQRLGGGTVFHLQVFLTVAESDDCAQKEIGEALNRSHQTVNSAVSRLMGRAGGTPLIKFKNGARPTTRRRRCVLTDEGETLFRLARPLLSDSPHPNSR